MEKTEKIEPLPPRTLLALALCFEGGLGLAAWLLGRIVGPSALSTLRWDAGDALWGIAAALPMLAGFAVCVHWPVGPLRRIRQASDELIRPLFAGCSVVDLALISLAAGWGEELLFRGFLQGALEERFGWLMALLAASVVFGLLHFITPTYAVYATLMGVYLGGVWLWSGNLLVVVVAHAFYDWVALVFLVKTRRSSSGR
jgi:uncharacterized protein